ncbi:MAG TPA: hypothetical protein VNP03_21195, partial [Pseudonocardia sp.]|nr:hypothetical protein [Pseudonocardia sp.]
MNELTQNEPAQNGLTQNEPAQSGLTRNGPRQSGLTRNGPALPPGQTTMEGAPVPDKTLRINRAGDHPARQRPVL